MDIRQMPGGTAIPTARHCPGHSRLGAYPGQVQFVLYALFTGRHHWKFILATHTNDLYYGEILYIQEHFLFPIWGGPDWDGGLFKKENPRSLGVNSSRLSPDRQTCVLIIAPARSPQNALILV